MNNTVEHLLLSGLAIVSLFAMTGCVPLNQFSVEQISNGGTKLDHFTGLESELHQAAKQH